MNKKTLALISYTPDSAVWKDPKVIESHLIEIATASAFKNVDVPWKQLVPHILKRIETKGWYPATSAATGLPKDNKLRPIIPI